MLTSSRGLVIATAMGAMILGVPHLALAQDASNSQDQTEADVSAEAVPAATDGADTSTPDNSVDAAPDANEASAASATRDEDAGDSAADPLRENADAANGEEGAAEDNAVTSKSVAFDPEMVVNRARELAQSPFENPHRDLPDVLENLSARDYDQIRFKSKRAFLNSETSGFSLEMFHLGQMYDVPVAINLIRDGQLQVIPYSAGLFDFGDTGLSGNDFSTQGYAGFRLRFPLSGVNATDELARFLGASYFRMQGTGQTIGQMGRGLALDLAGPSGEEIPVFREFWIVAPEQGAQDITVYALLDSARVTGAYRFVITPGVGTKADIQAHLFFREPVAKVGLAPLNSMFLFGEQRRRHFDDYRGEVHSSDGLLMNNGMGEWLWRPLDNPVNLQISSFLDENPRGFGLLQRDRNFDHYQDLDRRFDRQPGYWVMPKGDWGKGHVELVEIPSPNESNDNIVAYWVPENSPQAGDEQVYEYSITATRSGAELHNLAQATDTRLVRDVSASDSEAGRARFVLNFTGGKLDYYAEDAANITANISASDATVENVTIRPDTENGGVRVTFDVVADGDAASSNLRAFLLYDQQVLSETWTMPWVF
ncbi:glucan biosynthesis protein [Thalassospira sp. MA62]|nr:glucan biosynthesis protein [Thalassospira sp. MA62]